MIDLIEVQVKERRAFAVRLVFEDHADDSAKHSLFSEKTCFMKSVLVVVSQAEINIVGRVGRVEV